MTGKTVICISWQPNLAITRQALLTNLGLRVISALGEREARDSCREVAHLMILGHSVPLEERRKLINCFREYNSAPVLMLLLSGEAKLPEATHGIESADAEDVVRALQEILQN